MSLWIKLCGVRNEADIEAAIQAGADAVGIVLSPSPRQVSPEAAAGLIAVSAGRVSTVAVFYHPDPREVIALHRRIGFDLYQAEPTALPDTEGLLTVPVVHDSDQLGRDVAAARAVSGSGLVLVEGRGKGGHGDQASPDRLAKLDHRHDIVVAGGLNPTNVGSVVSSLNPGGVDVSSGIERIPGVKDHGLMEKFVAAARAAEMELSG